MEFPQRSVALERALRLARGEGVCKGRAVLDESMPEDAGCPPCCCSACRPRRRARRARRRRCRCPSRRSTRSRSPARRAERLNLIILGDGYQADQQSIFLADVDRNLAVMWATEPFRTLPQLHQRLRGRDRLDRLRRAVRPGRAGPPPDGTIRDTGLREGPIDAKNTALRMIFQNGCNDPLARGTVYGGAPVDCASYADYYPPGVNPCETGNQAHNRILDTYVMPVLGIPRTSQNVQTLAIFNTFTYGGIGGTQRDDLRRLAAGPADLAARAGPLARHAWPTSTRTPRVTWSGPATPAASRAASTTPIYTDAAQMVADQHKWWRWIGEESLSGGTIGLHEGGGTFPCGQRRPSQHSIMRWIGFDWDQVGREHMVARITGMRNAGQMSVRNTPLGTVAARQRAVGRDRASALPRAERDLADRRPDRPGDRHRQQPQPRPRAAEPRRRARSCTPRCATRSGRTGSTGCATRRPATPPRTPATTARGSCRLASGRSATRA